MSVEAMAACWGDFPVDVDGVSPTCVRVVALAIADVVNDLHGNELWASFDTIAAKVGVHRDRVRLVVRHLCAHGVLVKLEDRPGRTTRYRWAWFPVDNSRTPRDPREVTPRDPRGGSRDGTRGPRVTTRDEPNTTEHRNRRAREHGALCPGGCDGTGWVEVADRTSAPCPAVAG